MINMIFKNNNHNISVTGKKLVNLRKQVRKMGICINRMMWISQLSQAKKLTKLIKMRQFFLRMTLLLLSVIIIPTAASADTSVIQDGQDGWTKITSIPSEPSLYYFAFADNNNDLMLEMRKGNNNGNNALYYMTSKQPLENRSFLWTLEANSGNFAGMYSMRNVEYTVWMVQTEWNAAYNIRTNDQANPCEWTALNFQYDTSNGYWTIENGRYPMNSTASYKGYLGAWDNTITNGAELAGNKQDSNIGHFQI